jgi:hypothetical protein
MTAPLGDKEEELRAAAAQGHARAAEKASLLGRFGICK